LASQSARSLTHAHNGSCLRNYHATRLLRQHDQPQSQEQDRDAISASRKLRGIPLRGGQRIFRPADAAQEEVATKQPGLDEHDIPPELSESDLEAERLKASVRGLMRNVPSSVAVLTVASIDPKTKTHVPMGVAVSSLSTVTLDPPSVSFNLKEPSQTLDAIRAANGLFRVHFPAADRGGAKLVELFCRGNHADAYSMRTKELKLHFPKALKHPSTTPSLAPQIWDDFILGAMECQVTHELPVADHVVLVAKVDNLEHKSSTEPTMMYINGGYRKPKGEGIYPAGRTKAPSASPDVWSVWDSPLFPGAKEQQRYLKQIKTIVKGNPAYYHDLSRETYRVIDTNLPYAAANFGINLELLVAECRQELGLHKELKAELGGQNVLSDFYGPLTPSMREQIVARAKKLVETDSMFLSQNYRIFMHNLGVGPSSRDFLPSDIMEPLRAAGLVPAFEPRRGHSDSLTYDIRKTEQVEYHLREYLRKMPYSAALKTPFQDAMVAIGERPVAAFAFKKARSRLLTQTHPTVFDAHLIDIAGEVTQEELRVVICRLLNRLHLNSQTVFRKQMHIDWCETLRRVGVNPTITGMDVEFLLGKIKHIYYATRQFRDFPGAVDKMLEPLFMWSTSWDDFEERVKRFVTSLPLRAIAWQGKDRLAAMGLHWEATVTLPKQDSLDEEIKQPLSQGSILATLVAKELKSYYGKGSEQENQAIAKYLKEEYDFDVTHKPIAYTPAASPTESSGDEMQQAMMANVSAAQHQAWSAPVEPSYTHGNYPTASYVGGQSWKEGSGTGPKEGSGTHAKYASKHKQAVRQGGESPRIRFRQVYNIGKSGNTVNQVPGQVREEYMKREWKIYDIAGKSKL
jgi:flavin reductase (DIM6/NTAB) family NADH-FMN oxidoreductase RutF